jgi:hypothetical protein
MPAVIADGISQKAGADAKEDGLGHGIFLKEE